MDTRIRRGEIMEFEDALYMAYEDKVCILIDGEWEELYAI